MAAVPLKQLELFLRSRETLIFSKPVLAAMLSPVRSVFSPVFSQKTEVVPEDSKLRGLTGKTLNAEAVPVGFKHRGPQGLTSLVCCVVDAFHDPPGSSSSRVRAISCFFHKIKGENAVNFFPTVFRIASMFVGAVITA